METLTEEAIAPEMAELRRLLAREADENDG